MRNSFISIFILILTVISSCASTKPPVIYLPSQNSEVMSFYRNGFPIGVVNTDSSFIIVLLEPTELAGTEYMRLWFLYKNNSHTPFLLEPLKAVKLSILRTQEDRKLFDNITPESPAKILSHIKNEKTVTLIAQAIGGTLKAMSTQPTTITNPRGDKWVVNGRDAKVNAVESQTMSSMVSTAMLYDVFQSSVNSGILRRNTLFPGESVNGYVYFPLPVLIIDENGYNRHEVVIKPENCTYTLFITTQMGSKEIEFTPAEGE